MDPYKPDSVTTLVQTVMTLCHCTYVPQARYLTEEGETISASETRSVQTEEPDDTRVETAVQACEPEVGHCEVEVQTEPQETAPVSVPVVPTEDTVDFSVITSEDQGHNSVDNDNTITVEEHSFTFTAPIPVTENTFTATTPEPCIKNTFTMSTPEPCAENTFILSTSETVTEVETASSAHTVSQIIVSPPEEPTNVEFTFTFSLGDESEQNKKELVEDGVEGVAHMSAPDASRHQEDVTDADVSFSAVIGNEKPEKDVDDLTSIENRVPFSEYIRRRKSSSSASESFDISHPPHAPHSPIIRSKYPRRQRTDFRLHQMYIDTRTWKATPPRRLNRHRRPNSEKPYHCRSVTPASDDDSSEVLQRSPVRERTSSDSSMLQHKVFCSPRKECSGSELTVRHVNLLGSSQSGNTTPVTLDPFSRDLWFRKSPSPNLSKPLISPVRRLKTAAELLQDSENKRRSRSMSHDEGVAKDATSARISSSSSDKENDKHEPEHEQLEPENLKSDTAIIVVEQAGEHPPNEIAPPCDIVTEAVIEIQTATHAEAAPVTVQRRKTPSPSPPPPSQPPPSEPNKLNSKPPLKDRTNESKVKKMKAMLTGGGQQESARPKKLAPGRNDAAAKLKEKDKPKPGLVARQAELFQSKAKSDSDILTGSQTCRTKAVTVTVTPKAAKGKSDSAIAPLDEESSSRATGKQQKCDSDNVSSSTAEEPLVKKSQSSPQANKESKTHKLFGKKSNVAQSPKGSRGSPKKAIGRKGSTGSQKGAISALCASAMAVEVEDEQQPEPGTSSQGAKCREESVERKKKNKFLDGNWLQKPKKFFKASK